MPRRPAVPALMRKLTLVLPSTRDAPGIARRTTREALSRASEETIDSAELVVSELVTNSVRHAGASADDAIALEIAAEGDRLLVRVSDAGRDGAPERRTPDPGRAGGFGLPIVEYLSRVWGAGRAADGSATVWCELPARF